MWSASHESAANLACCTGERNWKTENRKWRRKNRHACARERATLAKDKSRVKSPMALGRRCPEPMSLSTRYLPVSSSRNNGCGVNDSGGSCSNLSTSEGL